MFKVKTDWLEMEYQKLNASLFSSVLPMVKFKVKKNLTLRIKKKKIEIWAYQEGCLIAFSHKVKNEQMARDILAHEMVHVWQDCVGAKDCHGKSFKMWKFAFKIHGLKLSKGYSVNDYDD